MALQFLGTLSLYQILPLLHFLTNYFKKKSTTAVADTTRQLVESWKIRHNEKKKKQEKNLVKTDFHY